MPADRPIGLPGQAPGRGDLTLDEKLVLRVPLDEPLSIKRVEPVLAIKAAVYEQVIKINSEPRGRAGQVKEPAETPLVIAHEALDPVVTQLSLEGHDARGLLFNAIEPSFDLVLGFDLILHSLRGASRLGWLRSRGYVCGWVRNRTDLTRPHFY